jgi:hypothetical protein
MFGKMSSYYHPLFTPTVNGFDWLKMARLSKAKETNDQ